MSMAHGRGSYTNTLGAVYEGEWKFDMQHGEGQEQWLDSESTFSGQFANGLRQGFGEWRSENKNYKGWWRANMMEGIGTMEWNGIKMSASANKSSRKSSISL